MVSYNVGNASSSTNVACLKELCMAYNSVRFL